MPSPRGVLVPSTYIAIAVALVAATMMHPTTGSLIAIILIVLLLVLLRFVSRMEGRRDWIDAEQARLDAERGR